MLQAFMGALLFAFVMGVTPAKSQNRETTLTNPLTGDSVTIRTDERGTTTTHVDGSSGRRSRGDRHDDYVRDYEMGGYTKRN